MTVDEKLDSVLEELKQIDRRLEILEVNVSIVRESFLSHRDRLASLERTCCDKVAEEQPSNLYEESTDETTEQSLQDVLKEMES